MAHRAVDLKKTAKAVLLLCLVSLLTIAHHQHTQYTQYAHKHPHRLALLAKCRALHEPAGPPAPFSPSESASDRFVPGTPPVLLRNARILTGARNGSELVFGDILLDNGKVIAVGYIPHAVLAASALARGQVQVVDVGRKWVSPGLVDLHSHIGVHSLPGLGGAADTNSRAAPILPWLRAIDGLNTHDAAYKLSVAGGVTTAQILPGSANNIGGQGFLIKLRPTADRSVAAMILEPPEGVFVNSTVKSGHRNWRHMKHACGENPSRVHAHTRMDSAWAFRQAYAEARKVKEAQDVFCAAVEQAEESDEGKRKGKGKRNGKGKKGKGKGKGEMPKGGFPESLQWEALVDVLRGRVKLSVHCYEAVDLDAIVRLSNEYKFPIASIHHAGETYLVPELLKKTWGGVPSIALFATNARKKREAYRASEFAPRILAEHDIPVVMKSDHPVVNSRYLMYEAQQAHYYGLHPALAIASVTSTPANAAGVGHRVGVLAPGYDADLVIWDSHPLALGATPVQVYIDGIPQLTSPHALSKPLAFQDLPKTPNWDKEKNDTVEWEGLPPLRGRERRRVRFESVRSVWRRDDREGVNALFDASVHDVSYGDGDGMGDGGNDSGGDIAAEGNWTVLVEDGKIVCYQSALAGSCADAVASFDGEEEVVDLQGGSFGPGLTTFGSPLGLVEIRLEPSTSDGRVLDPLVHEIPSILGGSQSVIRAVDGLQFGGRNTLLAYRGGVTRAITAPLGSGFLLGIATAFDVGANNALDRGAIIQAETTLHISISPNVAPSVSTQIAALRRLLLGDKAGVADSWKRVREGSIPLVVHVQNADIMATLIALKAEYERETGETLRLTFVGASEAHLLAEEIAAAGISVVLTRIRPLPQTWDQRRIVPGPPLSSDTAITILMSKHVRVAIGVIDEYDARNIRFDVAWAALDSNGKISRSRALALVTTNLEYALGLSTSSKAFGSDDMVVYQGGDIFDFNSKVVGVVSARRGHVEMF